MENTGMKTVILAAGKGTRLQSEDNTLPKVMRLAAGRPLLAHVLRALDFIPSLDCVIVVGYQKERVIEAFSGHTFAEQTEQLGTGHAVMAALSALEGYEGALLVCCGDMPLIKRETYLALVEEHQKSGNACTILTGTSELNLPYGRVLRDEAGGFAGILEDKDASPAQKAIRELNSGVYIFEVSALRPALSALGCNNAQKEYYLTDAPLLIQRQGGKVGLCFRELGYEIIGVNTPEQLREVEELLLK